MGMDSLTPDTNSRHITQGPLFGADVGGTAEPDRLHEADSHAPGAAGAARTGSRGISTETETHF